MVLGGPEPSAYAEEYLAAGAHVIVQGEGEISIPLAESVQSPTLYFAHGRAGYAAEVTPHSVTARVLRFYTKSAWGLRKLFLCSGA